MALQVVFAPQQRSRGLQDLLTLAEIYNIYDQSKMRDFDKAMSIEQLSGSPAELANVYDKVTGITDWLFNSPMYQRKKQLEQQAQVGLDLANKLYQPVQEDVVKPVTSATDMVSIADKVNQMVDEKTQKALLESKVVGSKIQKVMAKDKEYNELQKTRAMLKNEYNKAKGGIKAFYGDALAKVNDAITAKEAAALGMIAVNPDEDVKKEIQKKLANDKEYQEALATLQLQQQNEAQSPYTEAYQEISKKVAENPNILMSMPDDVRNQFINQYYYQVWNNTGSQIAAADAANAMLRTVNARLQKQLPYYDYLKQEKGGAGGDQKYAFIGSLGDKMVTGSEADTLQDALAIVGLQHSVRDLGAGTVSSKEKQQIYKEVTESAKAIWSKYNTTPQFAVSNVLIAAQLNNTPEAVSANKLLKSRNSRYRIWFESPKYSSSIKYSLIPVDEYEKRTKQSGVGVTQQDTGAYINNAVGK